MNKPEFKGFKKYFNSYTNRGRANVSSLLYSGIKKLRKITHV